MPSKFSSSLALVSLLLITCPALGQELKPDIVATDQIVAVVNGDPVTRNAVLQRSRLEKAYRRLEEVDDPRAEVQRRRFESSVLLAMIEEKLILQEAKRQKLSFSAEDQKDFEKELAQQAEPYAGETGLRNQLAKMQVSWKLFQEQIRANIMKGKLYFKVITRDLFVPPAELRQYYLEHPEVFRRDARTELRRIRMGRDADRITEAITAWLKTKKKDWDEEALKALAEELRLRIVAGEDAGLLARKYSTSRLDREKDGLYVFEDRKADYAAVEGVKYLDEIAPKLKEGEVSSTPTDRGYEVVYLELRRKRSQEPYGAVQEVIENKLKLQEWRIQVEQWTKDLKGKAVVRLFRGA